MSSSFENRPPRGPITPRPINPVGSLLNHLPMVLIIAVAIIGVGTVGVLTKIKPIFDAQTVLKIEPVVQKVLYGKEEASITPYYDDFVNTQINIVKSVPVLADALKIFQENGGHWQLPGESLEHAADRLSMRLNIQQIRDTQLFSISMTSRRKQGLAELINAVAQAYLEFNLNEQLYKDSSRLDFLNKRKVEIEKQLAENYAVLQGISAKYAVGITDEKNIYVYLQAIVDLTQQLVKATSQRIEVESRLNVLKIQLEELAKLDLSADIDDWVEKDWAIRDNRIQLSRKLQDFRLTLSGVDENHPDYLEYEENLGKLYEVQDKLIQRAKNVGEKVLRGKLLSDQNKKILELETDYAAALDTEKQLRNELKNAEQKATEVNTQMMQASTLRKSIQRLQDALLRIDERIDQIEVESRSSGRIRLISPARPPEGAASSKKSKMMALVILFGFGAGMAYAIGRDKLENKINTTEDIQRVLGFPATGFIMDAEQDKVRSKDYHRSVIEHPFSQISEQFKSIVLSLALEHDQHQSKIFTCFSIEENQGTTSFITNVLSALEGRKGKRLLVDLNLWHPLGKSLLPKGHPGILDVLAGDCSITDAIYSPDSYPFDFLSLGDLGKAGPHPFQEIGFSALIETMRLDYEYVFVDSPPLGLSSDAWVLAEWTDVAVIVIESGMVFEKALARMVSLLDRIGVKVISVVLNKVRFQRGKYYQKLMDKYYNALNASGMESRR